MPFERQAPAITPFARGAVVTAAQQAGIDRPDSVTLVADSGGVLGVAIARGVHGDHPVVLLQQMLTLIDVRKLANSSVILTYVPS